MASISPICKKCKIFILALKSPTYRDFMIKKIIEIQDIKISHLGTFKKGPEKGSMRYSHRVLTPSSFLYV
jgi:hypothetical protein